MADYLRERENLRVAEGERLLEAVKKALSAEEVSRSMAGTRPPYYREAMIHLLDVFEGLADARIEQNEIERQHNI